MELESIILESGALTTLRFGSFSELLSRLYLYLLLFTP